MKWMAMGILLPFILVPLLSMAAHGQELDSDPTSEEQQAFSEILTPVMTIYKLVKYAASIVGALALAIAGIMYMFSANDVHRRDQSKSWVAYIFMGLVVIWATPMMIGLMT